MITTALRLARDKADRGEMKLVNGALKEFAYSFRVFRKWRGIRKVTIFGSARTAPGEPVYEHSLVSPAARWAASRISRTSPRRRSSGGRS